MDKIIRRCLTLGFGCGRDVVDAAGLQAGQRLRRSAASTQHRARRNCGSGIQGCEHVMVKNARWRRHLFHLTGKTVVHGTESAGADALRGLEAGSAVVVHYAADAGEQTALEVDRLGDKG